MCVYMCHLAKRVQIGKVMREPDWPCNCREVWYWHARGKYLGPLRWTWQRQGTWLAVRDLTDWAAVFREFRLWNLEREDSTEVPYFLCLLLTPFSLSPLGLDVNGKTAREVAVFKVEWVPVSLSLSSLLLSKHWVAAPLSGRDSCGDATGKKQGGFCWLLSQLPERKWQGLSEKDNSKNNWEFLFYFKLTKWK